MQRPAGRGDRFEKSPHGRRNAMFVEGAHVVDDDRVFGQKPVFRLVDRPDTDHADMLRPDPRRQRRVDALEAFQPQEIGHRRAVQIAAARRGQRVEVRMRVQPQHELRAPASLRAARDTRHRADRQAVIAAEKDRHVDLVCCVVGRLFDRPGPAHGLREVAEGLVRMRHRRDRIGLHIAPIADLVPQFAQAGFQPCRSEGVGTHQTARLAGARLQGNTDQCAGERLHRGVQ